MSVTPIPFDAMRPDYQPLIPNLVIGENSWYRLQPDAFKALHYFLGDTNAEPFMLMQSPSAFDRRPILDSMLSQIDVSYVHFDLCYAYNPHNPLRPICLELAAGTAHDFCAKLTAMVANIKDESLRVSFMKGLLKTQPDNEPLTHYLDQLVVALLHGHDIQNATLISVLSSHSIEDGLPVVVADNIDRASLFGQIAYLTESGTISSNQHLLTPGLLHQANNGLLVLNIDELIDDPGMWFSLKQAVTSGQFDWQRNQHLNSPGFFIPGTAPLNCKVLLWGDRYGICNFEELDPSVRPQLAIAAEIKSEITAEENNLQGYLQLLLNNLKGGTVELKPDCANFLLVEASRLVEHNNFLTMDQTPLLRLIKMAQYQQQGEITLAGLQLAQTSLHNSINQQQLLSDQGYSDRQMKIDLKGAVVGQINGLSVLETPGLGVAFGEPLRITATVHFGDGDVADVERKAELAGNIHAKAMMIIQGFLTQKFGYENHLPLSGTLVFEQSYHEIDGDSASLAGLVALLSSLADKPINQSYATTGAIDQKGNVLAVGGINEKIEGYLRVCDLLDPDGHHNVIIPAANQVQLNLNQTVVDAVNDGRFSIYPIEHVDQAVELLFGIKAGNIQKSESLYGHIFLKAHDIYNHEQGRDSGLVKLLQWIFGSKRT